MKSHRIIALISSVLFLFLITGCSSESPTSVNDATLAKYSGEGPGYGGPGGGGPGGGGTIYELSQAEIDGLIHMRLEEKLARDVYTTFGDQYTANVFLKIKLSEQKHMDAVKRLLVKYNIPDPVTSNEIGVFPEGQFQTLYNNYIAQGSVSLTEALNVGVAIEVLDIADLDYHLANVVENPDIVMVYTNLKEGSVKHLAAFNNCLTNPQESAF